MLLIASVPLNTFQLNKSISDFLKTYESQTGLIEATISELAHDKNSINKIALTGKFLRTSPLNTFDLSINELDYSNLTKNISPSLKFNADLSLDLIKALGQEEVNYLAESLEELVVDFAEDYLKKYGQAALVSAQVLDKQVTKSGDYESLKIQLKLDVDTSKLPAETQLDQVELLSINMVIAVTTQTMSAQGKIEFNPAYSRFGDDAEGLKVELEKFVNNHQETLDQWHQYFGYMSSLVDSLLEEDNQ